MSQAFKFKYEEIRENNASMNDSTLDSQNPSRNICLVKCNGDMWFLNYSYLISGQFIKDLNTVELLFTSHKVTLKGLRLESLFYHLQEHQPKYLVCEEERYNAIAKEKKFILNEIQIDKL